MYYGFRGVRTCFPDAFFYFSSLSFVSRIVIALTFPHFYRYQGGRTCFPIAIEYVFTSTAA